jgi:anthraniloyl-CoA monooxygenase
VSDEFSKSYLEELFSREIDGHQLLVNNSRWGNFRTIKNESWHYKNFVLIGDSAHTAHFSVGSGTKMALEDASALAAAFEGYRGDLDQTLQTYEDSRRPGVDHIQGSAKPSLRWWENFGTFYQKLSPEQFSLHFFTRAITLGRLSHRDQAFVEDSLQWWKSNYGESPLESQFDLSGLVVLSRMVEVKYDENGSCWATFRSSNGFKSIKLVNNWGESILKDCGVIVTISQDQDGFEKAAAEIEDIAKKDPVMIAVVGGNHSDRRSLGEMCKLIHRIPTLIVEDQTDRDLGETLILSGRTDFVGWCR